MQGFGGRLTRGETSGDRRQFSNEKPKKKYVLLRLWKYLYRYKYLLLLAFILVIGSNLLALKGPSLSGKAINAMGIGKGDADFEKVFYYVTLMLVCYISSAILSYVLSGLMIILSKKIVYQMRKDVFEKLVSLPVGFFDRHQAGDIISVISYDIDTVNQSLSSDFLQVLKSLITVIGSLWFMLNIAPTLVLVFAFTIPLSVVFTRYITKKVRPLFRDRSSKLGELNGFVEEMTAGQKTTKAYNREEQIISEFDIKNEEAVKAYTKAEYYGTVIGPGVNFVNNLSLAMVSVFGVIAYLKGSINIGDISSFVQYSRKFSGPINETANIIGDFQSAFAAAERVFGLIDQEPEKADSPDAAELTAVEGNVEILDVCFGYTADRQIIHNLSLKANKGDLIAIVGPTGAGKTTIVNLLMRFYDVNEGEILIDDKSIYEVTRSSLRSAYTMVLQDTWLFHGTVFENLSYGKENVTPEEVTEVCKAARIHSFITRLPKGYDTVITDNGINISKGQKQLLTIARAMLLESKMLILDEATSNVDTRTEQLIQQAMRSLMKGKTCFVIAHRLSTIQNADLIIVVKDGNIVEQGNHKELMAKGGFYSELYYSQFETY
ncbi:MAG: ABC transporter ATP-binding protein [Clostridiales bacterium]|nr:ABC transporter ATP-binding protein [Clostridiales bacterium]